MSKIDVFKHLELIGHTVKDKITGFRGIVTAIRFDLYGCIIAEITSEKYSETGDVTIKHYDLIRLEVDTTIDPCQIKEYVGHEREKLKTFVEELGLTAVDSVSKFSGVITGLFVTPVSIKYIVNGNPKNQAESDKSFSLVFPVEQIRKGERVLDYPNFFDEGEKEKEERMRAGGKGAEQEQILNSSPCLLPDL